MDPPFRSRISHDPSLPSISTEPDAPSLTARPAEEWWRALARDREALFERVRAASPDGRPDRTVEQGMFGPLTWREALLFLRLHDLDHAGQLRKIATALTPPTGDTLPSA